MFALAILMACFFPSTAMAFPGLAKGIANGAPMDSVLASAALLKTAAQIDGDAVAQLPILHNGRIKPLDSLARETLLFISGKRSQEGLSPLQLYLALSSSPAAADVEILNIRSPELRRRLGFANQRRQFSLREVQGSELEDLASPLRERAERDSKSLNAEDKEVLEASNQMWLLAQIVSGRQLPMLLDTAVHTGEAAAPVDADAGRVERDAGAESLDVHQGGPSMPELASAYLQLLPNAVQSAAAAAKLLQVAAAQSLPPELSRQRQNMWLEVTYNQLRPFLWAAVLYLALAIAFLVPAWRPFWTPWRAAAFFAFPFLAQFLGFAARVWITGFAPVTNMYGTMLWVSLGVGVFALTLFALYRAHVVVGLLWLGSALILLLTESLPLVLSPDMDPIVAVLRSNYWLTIHVLTITASYAAFTIAMLVGNAALVRSLFNRATPAWVSSYSRYAYRMIQLGVFLLTVGIILGGLWADVSWGRFWGWDPKETWALIADLGFLAILHARYIGWLTPLGLLAASPAAYLLVVMAWYGVNFILAAGLHSYGFSSGGALAVGVFVALQVGLMASAWVFRAGLQKC